MLYVPLGRLFGDSTSSEHFERLARARRLIAKIILNKFNLIEKYEAILNKVKFSNHQKRVHNLRE